MNTNAKLALALAIPAVGMFVGAMMLRGPKAQLGRAQKPKRVRYWRRQAERERKALEKMKARAGTGGRSLYQHYFGGDERPLAELTPSEINRRLNRLDKISSKITQELIDTGRGHEKPSETWQKSDPLALRYKARSREHDALHAEIARRYGPGAPSWMPTRERKSFGGFGHTPEKHAALAEEKRQAAVGMMSKALQSLTRKKCHMAVLQAAQAQRRAGEAYAHAEDHVADRYSFHRLEEDLDRMTATVAKACRRYTPV